MKKNINSDIAESINKIVDFCFSYQECKGCPLYDSIKTCKICTVPSAWDKPIKEGDNFYYPTNGDDIIE